MITNAKINERLAFSRADQWVSMQNYDQVAAVAIAPDASPETEVTVQLRKATDASGSNAADLGTAVAANSKAVAQAFASALGETAGGLAFTHVSATITDAVSPNSEFQTVVIRGAGRFNP